MREVITRIWCDEHLKRAEEELIEATAVELGNEGKWFTLDLCPGCRAESIDPLMEFLADFGVRVDEGVAPPTVMPFATKASARPVKAPDPGLFELDTSAAKTSPATAQEAADDARREACAVCATLIQPQELARHYRRVHKISRQPFGSYCPVCDQPLLLANRHFQEEHEAEQEAVWRAALKDEDAGVRQRAQATLDAAQGA